jgi:hypothetical protein
MTIPTKMKIPTKRMKKMKRKTMRRTTINPTVRKIL